MNLQVIASPSGSILWVSGALPGSVHDKRAEWVWGVLHEIEAAGLVTLADKGHQGSAREDPRSRRKGKRPAQDLADPPQAPLLPLPRRATRQGHPRPGDTRRIIRMKRLSI
jgi:hypothetical protein